MIRDVLTRLDLSTISVITMLMFLICFAMIVGWALTRSRRDVKRWSHLPLDSDSNAREHHHE